ncbi:MAG: 16S rRNA (guanine(966)-N(2))-methyltransferase RsmD [Acidimicrobiia bacterium]|nr:16S rRNA (guanine(966)-N(2))-methyltransferase RsmD [Acidimicrobiia bacterium]
MRIIAGVARGRRLLGPRGGTTRPFPDRVKEALFSSLGDVVVDAVVLDLFAGTGSLGLEALSRGAGAVTFVERDRSALAVLRENIARVGLGGTVVAADVGRFLAHPGGAYHLAFVDPPYDQPLPSVARILEGLEPAVTDGGVVVVHRRRGEEPPLPDSLVLTDRRRYGQAEVWRLEARRHEAPS